MSNNTNNTNNINDDIQHQLNIPTLCRCSNYLININLISNLPYCNRCDLHLKPHIRIDNDIITYYCQICNNIIGYVNNNIFPIGNSFIVNNHELIWLNHFNTIILSYNDNWHPYMTTLELLNIRELIDNIPNNHMLAIAKDGYILYS